jgi:hypothetical protein
MNGKWADSKASKWLEVKNPATIVSSSSQRNQG